MAHKGVLRIDNHDKEYIVIECSYTLTQRMSYNNIPAEKPRAGEIQITTVAPSDIDMFFHRWMQDPVGLQEGEIVLQVVDNVSVVDRTIKFKDAYCINIYEYFNMHNSDQMHIRITISASEIAFGGNDEKNRVVFKNNKPINPSSAE